jgi:penicillin-binding protein 2
MTAQIANGGYSIKPKIIVNNNPLNFDEVKKSIKEQNLLNINTKLVKNPKNLRIIQEAMFSSTNEIRGTSYRSRIDDKKYQFAGKTGTAQVKRITKEARELDLETSQIDYKDRDHALYIAFGPYKNPRYSVSIIIEHGGSGSSTAAPIAKKLFRLLIDRHELRQEKINQNLQLA